MTALGGTAWEVTIVGGDPVHEDVAPTVAFDEDGTMRGHGGVNRFGGSYELRDESVEFGPVWSTRMAGPEEAMDLESRFFSVLEGTRLVRRDGELLVLGEGAESAVLRPAPDL